MNFNGESIAMWASCCIVHMLFIMICVVIVTNYVFFLDILVCSMFALIMLVKGIVHPKMKIRSSFTHPQVVPNLYECLCSAEHKGRYSEECGKQSSYGAPLTSIVYIFSYCGSQWCPKTAWLQTFFRIYRFGTTWGWVNDDQIFIFWVNYPFKWTDLTAVALWGLLSLISWINSLFLFFTGEWILCSSPPTLTDPAVSDIYSFVDLRCGDYAYVCINFMFISGFTSWCISHCVEI